MWSMSVCLLLACTDLPGSLATLPNMMSALQVTCFPPSRTSSAAPPPSSRTSHRRRSTQGRCREAATAGCAPPHAPAPFVRPTGSRRSATMQMRLLLQHGIRGRPCSQGGRSPQLRSPRRTIGVGGKDPRCGPRVAAEAARTARRHSRRHSYPPREAGWLRQSQGRRGCWMR